MKEVKICLPAFKVTYSICFTVILSLVRGISNVTEIGITLDAYMPVLAIVFCADAYRMEYSQKRWEVFRLYPVGTRRKTILKRLVIQWIYLCVLTFAGYACFYWQRPMNLNEIPQILLYGMSMGSVAVSIIFWGAFAMTVSNIFGNIWAGIGISVILWMAAYSTSGERILGKFNVFSFIFRDIADVGDWSWLWGKGTALVLTAVMLVIMPVIIKKRG